MHKKDYQSIEVLPRCELCFSESLVDPPPYRSQVKHLDQDLNELCNKDVFE